MTHETNVLIRSQAAAKAARQAAKAVRKAAKREARAVRKAGKAAKTTWC